MANPNLERAVAWFHDLAENDPKRLERFPERFVWSALDLDHLEDLEALRRVQAMAAEEGAPVVYALFRGGRFLGAVLPGEVMPA